jgi:hypothetical protein
LNHKHYNQQEEVKANISYSELSPELPLPLGLDVNIHIFALIADPKEIMKFC